MMVNWILKRNFETAVSSDSLLVKYEYEYIGNHEFHIGKEEFDFIAMQKPL